MAFSGRRFWWFSAGAAALAVVFAGDLRVAQPEDASASASSGHWAFQIPARPSLPVVGNAAWAQNPIDAFVAAEHERRGLKPAPPADRRTLIVRLSLDLVGLPPSPDDVQALVDDRSGDAYERLVERLLSSPGYGQRWGRHWLDLVRWAESDGFEKNDLRKHAWRYRDYVVDSFNAGKPYDRFLREQIAGDEIEPYSDTNLIATGFLAATRTNENEEDKVVQLNEPLVDITNTLATVALGLTLGCAQCHDHKFEPLSAVDYYSLHAFFLRGQTNSLLLKNESLIERWQQAYPKDLDELKLQRNALYDPVLARLKSEARDALSEDQRTALDTPATQRSPEQAELAREAEKKLAIGKSQVQKALEPDERKKFDELDRKVTATEAEYQEQRPQTWGFYSPATSPHPVDNLPPRGQFPFKYEPGVLKQKQPIVLTRGDVYRPGEAVTPNVPAVLRSGTGFGSTSDTSASPSGAARPHSGDRSALVDWLVGDENPLTARVWVNFVWQQHFGRGIVPTAGDFGVRGEPPTHRELLDWLAVEFRETGWSTKHLHRLIVTSNTYRQAATVAAENAKRDPDNRYLWRFASRRLESEALRDRMLAVGGLLDTTAGGPSDEDSAKSYRRSVYLLRRRYHFPGTLALFDAPTANEACTRRHVSTVPLQPLYLLNSAEVVRIAEAFAGRVKLLAGDETGRQIEAAFRLALARGPNDRETAAAKEFFDRQPAGSDGSAPASASQALVHFCHTLLNLNELAYLE